jgi:hypothetical protein
LREDHVAIGVLLQELFAILLHHELELTLANLQLAQCHRLDRALRTTDAERIDVLHRLDESDEAHDPTLLPKAGNLDDELRQFHVSAQESDVVVLPSHQSRREPQVTHIRSHAGHRLQHTRQANHLCCFPQAKFHSAKFLQQHA